MASFDDFWELIEQDRKKAEEGKKIVDINDHRKGAVPNVENPDQEQVNFVEFGKKINFEPIQTDDNSVRQSPSQRARMAREQRYNETRRASVNGKKPRDLKIGRKEIFTGAVTGFLALVIALSAYAYNHSDSKQLARAERMLDNAEEYTQTLLDDGKNTPREFAEAIDHESVKEQQDHLMQIALAQNDTTPEELLEYEDNPEYTEGEAEDINTTLQSIVDNDESGLLKKNIDDVNNPIGSDGPQAGLWKSESLSRQRKGAK